MSDAVKTALITAGFSLIAALISASVTLWSAEREHQREKEKAAQQEEQRKQQEAQEAEQEFAVGETVVGEVEAVNLRRLSVSVSYNKNGKTITARDPRNEALKADICFLTAVSSYGGASKTCSLTQEEEGWVLVSSARKATSSCHALCFDFPKMNS